MSTTDEIWIDRGYETRHIPNLPRDLRLPSEGVTVTVDYARKAEVTSLLPEFMKAAAERADNVGIDEFDSERQEFFVEFSEVFVLRSPVSKSDIRAFIIIGPTLYAHQYDSCIGEIQVIRSPDTTDATYGDLVELAIDFTEQLDIGYTHSLMAVSANCQSLVHLLENRLGFRQSVVVPRCVNVALEVGLTDNVIVTRKLRPTAADIVRQMRSSADVLSMLSRHGVVDGPEDDIAFSKALVSLSRNDTLPQVYTLKRSGLTVKLRDLAPGDDRSLYELTRTTANRGEGYSIYEFPNLASFRERLLSSGSRVVVMEDVRNGRTVGFFLHSPSGFQRSPAARIEERDAVLDKEYQNRGIAKDLQPFINATSKQLGSVGVVSYYFSNNIRSQRLSEAAGQRRIGNIPSAGYLVGTGWLDAVVISKYLEDRNKPTLNEINQRVVTTKKSASVTNRVGYSKL